MKIYRNDPASRGNAPAFLALALAFLAACGPSAPPLQIGDLLAAGIAQAEIDQWPEALALFQQAAESDPASPRAAFDVAVAHYRLGDLEAAGDWLERALAGALPGLAARGQLLRAKLAYEAGDVETELEAHREAARLDPEEPAYLHALGELYSRLPEPPDRGEVLAGAYRLRPDNARLGAAYARWALEQPQAETRRRGLEVLAELAAAAPGDDVAAYVERGREELGAAGWEGRTPTSLRRAMNLLRATKKFAGDASEISERLEVMPVAAALPEAGPSAVADPRALEIELQPAALVPAPPLGSAETIVELVVVDDMVGEDGAVAESEREAAVALLSDRGLYLLPRQGESWESLGEIAGGRALLAGDLDDDGRPELLAFTDQGLRRWSRGDAETWAEVPGPELADAGAYRQALLVDFEHDGDLDLLALDAGGRPALFLHRGEAGLAPPEPAPLPVDQASLRCLAAADLDGDNDQDLILASATELLVLRNWRQGDYGLHWRDALSEGSLGGRGRPLPPGEGRGEGADSDCQLLPLDHDSDGLVDVMVRTSGALAVWRGAGRAQLERDPAAGLGGTGPSSHLAAADLDLDGDLDLLAAGDASVTLLRNSGRASFELQPLIPQSSTGLLPLDLDGDRDRDLLTWEGGELASLESRGAEGQNWLLLSLRAPNRKVPLDGRGVRVEVAAGGRVHHLHPRRPNLVLGLGDARPSLVKATWPNGISEYLFEPPANARHVLTLSLRVEGSCPFLYASDAQGELRFVTDILGLSPLGMLAAPGVYVPADPEEYLRLPDWVEEHDGAVELLVTEELREAAYLDQGELVAVDVPPGIEALNGEQWLPEPIAGLALRLLGPLSPPASVRDHRGREVLDIVAEQDHRYLTNHVGENRYQGAVEPHRLIVELPPEVAAAERPALILVGWLHWGNTSTNLARSQDPAGAPLFPILEVSDGAGGWRLTATPVGLPAGKTKPVVVDLTGVFDPGDRGAGPPRLSITTDFEVYWDRIAVAELLPGAEHRLHRLAPATAELRFGGFSRWYRPAANGPYLFDYRERRPYPWRQGPAGRELPLAWQEHEGYYTAFGEVTPLLTAADDRFAVFGAGEEVLLRFETAELPALPAGWRRVYFFHSEGWEKDGDPNVACSQTVEPLPYRGMARYPCPPGPDLATAEPPADAAPRTRWVDRGRLERRLLAAHSNSPTP